MQEFRVFRALGLAFQSWFRNFIPFTLLAAILYSPVVIWIAMIDPEKATSLEDLLNSVFIRPGYALAGASVLLAPMITYRVIQELNGTKVSMFTSIKFGFRGILPALIVAVVSSLVQFIPMGWIIGAVVMCVWFVGAPAAVAEQLGPVGALKRSGELTHGRRLRIFGLTLLIGIVLAVFVMAWLQPKFEPPRFEVLESPRKYAIIFVVAASVIHLLFGIVEAVSYALLREDKDGVTHEQLARVFD
jgi:hypothetical protein